MGPPRYSRLCSMRWKGFHNLVRNLSVDDIDTCLWTCVAWGCRRGSATHRASRARFFSNEGEQNVKEEPPSRGSL